MSTYHLTEAYGDLHNPRLTDSSYFDNLRFVDHLTTDDMQEVMEGLIWEFMDYGDSFEEATKILETAFSDDQILCESIELISEARVDMAARREQRQRQAEASAKTSKMKMDTIARARRAERASAVRGALRGAKETVKGALHAAHQKVTNARSQLAAKGASAALRGQAALSKVARAARGAVKGAVAGARQELQTPSKAPSSRISGRQQTQQMRAAARKELGDVFSDKPPSTIERLRAAAAADRLRSAAKTSSPKKERIIPTDGQTVHGGPAPAPPPPLKKSQKVNTSTSRRNRPERDLIISTREKMKGRALPPSGKTSGSTKGGRVLTASQRQMKNTALSRRLNADIDYDALAQYMIEDIINEGYATSEQDALYILENMRPETLNELIESYLID